MSAPTYNPGDRVKFRVDGVWHIGTVRKAATDGPFAGEFRVDDGDPSDNDLFTNGFVRSAWVPARDLLVLHKNGGAR